MSEQPQRKWVPAWQKAPPPDEATITWLRHLFPNWGKPKS